jgi:hypothetical protein
VVGSELPLPTFCAGTDTLGVIVGLSSDLYGGHRTPGDGALTGLLREAESAKRGLGPVLLALVGELIWEGGQLQKWEGRRCTVWYQPGSPAARDVDAVGRECESALRDIELLLSAHVEERVIVLLFGDWRSKMYGTRTLGWGSGGDGRMAMVYEGTDADRETLLHELCHVVAGAMGSNNPPACLAEGLGELVGKTRGELRSVQAGRIGADEVTAANLCGGRLWTLQELIQLSAIGPEGTNPAVAYPEAASLCAFLIRQVGFDGFRKLYRELKSGDLPLITAGLERATGRDLTQLEADWHAYLTGKTD